ncbi:MAG TPA: hypothetical protein VJJ83_03690 [Candidatus Babeliales bacterium]|nr:hypothetical protein [Candidatus Babeliales bacterium]
MPRLPVKSLVLLISLGSCCANWALDRHPTREYTASSESNSIAPGTAAPDAVDDMAPASCCTKLLDRLCCIRSKTDCIMLFGDDRLYPFSRTVQNSAYEQYLLDRGSLASEEQARLARERAKVERLVRQRVAGNIKVAAALSLSALGVAGIAKQFQRNQHLKLD